MQAVIFLLMIVNGLSKAAAAAAAAQTMNKPISEFSDPLFQCLESHHCLWSGCF